MQHERESLQSLEIVDYHIAGNDLQAFYDADGKLVCVLDNMISDVKPNVLLVINPVGDRKWDDILANDYGVDLEVVRPKKDNKYQKLDVEYTGLAQYDNLIRAYTSDDDLSDVLAELGAFRNQAAYNSATERLQAANLIIEKAQETIEKTEDSINQIQEKIKQKRVALSQLRKNIGREPTKQSAAKILKTESQIDAANEKLGRAKKRLANAQSRLDSATNDADVAQEILNNLGNGTVQANITTKVENMPDDKNDDVKPLFDQDPKILDDQIAFKPIDFGNVPMVEPENPVAVRPEPQMPAVQSEPQMPAVAEQKSSDALIQPLTFTPPVSYDETSDVIEEYDDEIVDDESDVPGESVLDAMTPVASEEVKFVSDDVFDDLATKENVPAPIDVKPVVEEDDAYVVAPVDTENMVRPESPQVDDVPVESVMAVENKSAKTTLVYYGMLLILIILSIFTLWTYQRSANDNLPELGAKAVAEEPIAEPEVAVQEDLLFFEEPVVAEPEPVSVVESVVEPAPVVEPEPAPVVDTVTEPVSEPESVPVAESVVEPAPVVEPDVSVVVNPDVVIEPDIPTEEEILASKPAYGVSQQDKMFVASPEYETAEVVETETIETCSDGNAPDADGCCAGESLSQLPNGQLACCSETTGECFPPMF